MIIYNNLDFPAENLEEDYAILCEENEIEKSEIGFTKYVFDYLTDWFYAERENLRIPCGDILVIADLGLWNGRVPGYKILTGKMVSEILFGENICVIYDEEKGDVTGEEHHHDGTNYYLFRELRDGIDHKEFLESVLCGKEISKQKLNAHTRSLKKYIKEAYFLK